MTTGTITHDNYKQLPTPDDLPACPCCGSAAEVWQYSDSPSSPTTKAVMCGNGTSIVESLNAEEALCPLYMPPQYFYHATVREAINFWKRYKRALLNRRMKNTLGEIWPSGN